MVVYAVVSLRMDKAPTLGRIVMCHSYKAAEDIAVTICMEQLGGSEDDSEEVVRKELENTGNYWPPSGEWSVCIGLPE